MRFLKFLAFSAVIFAGVAGALLAWPVPAPKTAPGAASAQLGTFVEGIKREPPATLTTFTARDGAKRSYRLYPGTGGDLVVLLHGSSTDSRYLAHLARAIASGSGATVATPDMRGHGPEPGQRGDVARTDQLETDIADLISALRRDKSYQRILLAGHSIGGGLAIRYAAGQEAPRPDGLILLAPYIHRHAPSARPDTGGWATPFVTRFAGIQMLQGLRVHAFDNLPVLRFEVPPSARDGTETPLYSWRMFAAITPRADWRTDIARIPCPVLVLAAETDVIFNSAGYGDVFKPLAKAKVEILPGLDHFQLTTSGEVPKRVMAWLAQKP